MTENEVEVIMEQIGTFTMDDGRQIKGAIISFPEEGCCFPLKIVWHREPLKLMRSREQQPLPDPPVME